MPDNVASVLRPPSGGFVPASDASSLIGGLLFVGRPFAVFRKVAKIVINAVNRHSFGALSHVGYKAFEVMPCPAKSYSSAAIVFVSRVLHVAGALFHVEPRDVSRGLALPMRAPKRTELFMFCAAPARSGFAGSKVANLRMRRSTTFALAKPNDFIVFLSENTYGSKFPEFLIRKVKSFHAGNFNIVCHKFG